MTDIQNKAKESVWVIRHKETKEILAVPSGKNSWRKPSHAKNAWNTFGGDVIKRCEQLGVNYIKEHSYYSVEGFRICFPKFDQQDTYELYDCGKDAENEANELLNKCLGRLTDSKLEKEIREYLRGNV